MCSETLFDAETCIGKEQPLRVSLEVVELTAVTPAEVPSLIDDGHL